MEQSPPPETATPRDAWDGQQLRAAFAAAARWFEQHAEDVNALNVFPVPDGDTGTNMALTLNSAASSAEAHSSAGRVAERLGYWAMMRGRGNSGIILSQILRGFAQGVGQSALLDAPTFATGLHHASTAAYQAVMKPVEGTMLTVIRETSEAVTQAAPTTPSLEQMLAVAAQAAHESVERTPTLLKTLRDAGVVDSGGYGLSLIFDGLLRYARGESVEREGSSAPVSSMAFDDIHGEDAFGYCTNFVIEGQQMPFERIRDTFAAMGQSVAVVGDDTMIKVHIHLLKPGEALNYAVEWGALANIEITNMDAQRAALHEDAATEEEPPVEVGLVGVVAVAPGAGFRAIFRSLGVGAVIEGGQTMNPSTTDILDAIMALPQQDVIVLPNNGNIVLAAQQAARLSDRRVLVVPTRTVPQGVSAMLAYNAELTADELTPAMDAARAHVITGEVTTAVRNATVDGVTVRSGQAIGLVDDVLISADDALETVLTALLDAMGLDEREILTIYYGNARTRSDADGLAAQIGERYPDVAVEVQEGGQALYDYILSAE